MKAKVATVVLAAIVLAAAGAAAHGQPADVGAKAEEKTAEIQRLLTEAQIDTDGLQEEMPLEKALVVLEAKLPDGKNLTLRIDETAFGDRLRQVADAKVMLPRMKNVRLVTVLRRILAQAAGVEELDFGIRPSGVVITQPQLAAHPMVYEVRDVIEQMPLLLPDLKQQYAELYQDVDPADGSGLLVRLVANDVELRPWEAIQVQNRSRLVVTAAPMRQEQVTDLLASLRSRSDVGVVMNARLYEVDRAFYTWHVAPRLPADADPDERPVLISIDGPLFKKVAKQKELLRSDEVSVRPGQTAFFLSQENVFRFNAGPDPDKEGGTRTGTGATGVSFKVRPLVSPDRRYLRLQVTQQAAQLVGIDKARTLDAASGKETEVDSPNVHRTSWTGTVQILDAHPILMPVAYRPPSKANEGKVWLLAARPFIRIEEEVKEIRKAGGDLTGQSVWDSDVSEEHKPAPPTPLPLSDDVREILQAVIADVLTNPDLKYTHEFYGTARDRTLALVDEGNLGWPKGFVPETHGYKLVQVKKDPFENQRRVLGIRLDKFDLEQKKAGLFDAPIEVCVFNAGGHANGGVIGGCSVYYVPKRDGKHWTVEYEGLLDP